MLAVNKAYLEKLITTVEEAEEKSEDILLIEDKIANIQKQLANIALAKASIKESAVEAFPRELNVLETTYNDVFISYPNTLTNDKTIKYPAKMRFFPYIKDGRIQEFSKGA